MQNRLLAAEEMIPLNLLMMTLMRGKAPTSPYAREATIETCRCRRRMGNDEISLLKWLRSHHGCDVENEKF